MTIDPRINLGVAVSCSNVTPAKTEKKGVVEEMGTARAACVLRKLNESKYPPNGNAIKPAEANVNHVCQDTFTNLNSLSNNGAKPSSRIQVDNSLTDVTAKIPSVPMTPGDVTARFTRAMLMAQMIGTQNATR